MPATDDDTLLPFSLPSIGQKKITAAFDGGLISSDGGVLLLAGADKRFGLIDTLAAIIPDHREAPPAPQRIAPLCSSASHHPFNGGHSARPRLRHRLRLPGCR
jgi:hypothetical protein